MDSRSHTHTHIACSTLARHHTLPVTHGSTPYTTGGVGTLPEVAYRSPEAVYPPTDPHVGLSTCHQSIAPHTNHSNPQLKWLKAATAIGRRREQAAISSIAPELTNLNME